MFSSKDFPPSRNPILADAIREGFPFLQEQAQRIQASPKAREVFLVEEKVALKEEKIHASSAHAYLSFHIKEAAEQALEDASAQNGDWTVKNEPVQILDVKLSVSRQHATIYWTLPPSRIPTKYSVEQQPDLFETLLEIQNRYEQVWQPRELLSAIQFHLQRFRFKRLPALRLEPATENMLTELLVEQASESHGVNDIARLFQ